MTSGLIQWLVDLLERYHPCGPDCPCLLIMDNSEIAAELNKRNKGLKGPKAI